MFVSKMTNYQYSTICTVSDPKIRPKVKVPQNSTKPIFDYSIVLFIRTKFCTYSYTINFMSMC